MDLLNLLIFLGNMPYAPEGVDGRAGGAFEKPFSLPAAPTPVAPNLDRIIDHRIRCILEVTVRPVPSWMPKTSAIRHRHCEVVSGQYPHPSAQLTDSLYQMNAIFI